LIRRDYLAGGVSIGPGDTVLDVGANIGSFAVLAGSLVAPAGRVLAFEPVAETFARLEGNVRLNGLDNVECRRAAVDARDGTMTLNIGLKSAMASAHLGVEDGDVRSQEVPSVTLGRVLDEHKVDRVRLLKLDCEGSEHGIFETMTPELAARIDQVAMEFHPVAGKTPGGLEARMRDLGFDVRPGQIWFAFNRAARPGSS
jgi:FkbM family methyltransferase